MNKCEGTGRYHDMTVINAGESVESRAKGYLQKIRNPRQEKKAFNVLSFFLEELVIVCRECDLRLYLSHRIYTTNLTRAKGGFEKTTSYLTKEDNAKLAEIGLRTGSCSLLVFNLMDEPSASETINANEIAS